MDRQRAIRYLHRMSRMCDMAECPYQDCGECFDALATAMKALNDDELEGEWLMNGGKPCECSLCGHQGNITGKDNYCHYCGARMRR